MDIFTIILFWTGIVFLVDGAIGLLTLDKWERLVSGVNIQRISWIEITTAVAMLMVHYLLSLNLY